MTFLQLVNDVLQRLREPTVATVATSKYSILIGKFINDAKYQVENAWNWDALNTTIIVTTVAGTSNYLVTGSGTRQKGVNVNDTTNKTVLSNTPIQNILNQQQLTTVQNGNPTSYAWYGTNGTDSKVELFPIPDGVYSIKFNMYAAQPALTADADVLLVPGEAVIAGAYARALVERGEDGGLNSSEAYGLYRGILADQIALEATRFIENDCWVAV